MSGGGTALLSVSRRRIELLVNKHSLTAALSCFIPVLQGSCLLILIVISPLSSILATLISSFEPWDHGNLDCNEWAGRWCPIKLAGNAAELGGGYTQFGHYNYFYDLLNYASPPN